MNLGGNLDVNLGGKTHNFATLLLLLLCGLNTLKSFTIGLWRIASVYYFRSRLFQHDIVWSAYQSTWTWRKDRQTEWRTDGRLSVA